MGNITIPGPLRTGRRNNAHSTTIGHVAVQQKVGVSGAAAGGTDTHTHTFADRLPACDITGIRAVIESTFGATAAAIVHFKVGTTAAASAFGTYLVLSPGVYDFGVVDTTALGVEAVASALSNWKNIAEGTQVVVTVTAALTANPSSRGTVYVSYYQNSAATV